MLPSQRIIPSAPAVLGVCLTAFALCGTAAPAVGTGGRRLAAALAGWDAEVRIRLSTGSVHIGCPPSASCALSTAAQPAELLLPGQPGDPVLAGTHAIKTTVLHLCYRLWLRLMLMPELPAAAAAAATVEHPALPIRAPLLVAPSPRQRMSMDLTAWKRPSTAAGRCSTATWSRACSSASTPGCTATRRSPTTGRCGLAVVGAGPSLMNQVCQQMNRKGRPALDKGGAKTCVPELMHILSPHTAWQETGLHCFLAEVTAALQILVVKC